MWNNKLNFYFLIFQFSNLGLQVHRLNMQWTISYSSFTCNEFTTKFFDNLLYVARRKFIQRHDLYWYTNSNNVRIDISCQSVSRQYSSCFQIAKSFKMPIVVSNCESTWANHKRFNQTIQFYINWKVTMRYKKWDCYRYVFHVYKILF